MEVAMPPPAETIFTGCFTTVLRSLHIPEDFGKKYGILKARDRVLKRLEIELGILPLIE